MSEQTVVRTRLSACAVRSGVRFERQRTLERWTALGLVALAALLASVGARGQEESYPLQQPAVHATAISDGHLEDLRRQYEAATDPVETCALRERMSVEQRRVELERLRATERQWSGEAIRGQRKLAELQWDLLQQADRLRTRGTMSACKALLRRIRSEEKQLLATKSEIEARLARLEAQSLLASSAQAGAHGEDARLEATSPDAPSPAATPDAARPLEAPPGLPTLDQWPEQWRDEFTSARRQLPVVLSEQHAVLERLHTLQQSHLSALEKALTFLRDRADQIVAIKDRLFWMPEPIPYSAQTVADAWGDLKGLASEALHFTLALPSSLAKAMAGLGGSPRLLVQFVLAALLLGGGLFLALVIGRRARLRLEESVARRRALPLSADNRVRLMLLRLVAGEVRFWFALIPLAAAWLLLATLQGAYQLASANLAVGRLDPYPLALAILGVYAVVAACRLLGRMSFEVLSPERGEERLLRVPASVAQHVQRGVGLLLASGLVMLTPIAVLKAISYNPDFISLLWTVLRVLVFLCILWLVARRGMIRRLFGQRKTLPARVAYRLLRVLYPVIICAILLLLVFRSIGFVAFSRSLVLVTIELTVGLFVIGLAVWWLRVWLKRLETSDQSAPSSDQSGAVRSLITDHRSLMAAARGTRRLLGVVGAVAACYFVVKLLSYHYRTAIFSEHAPAFVRIPAERCAAGVGGGLSWLTQPILGETMSPLSLLLGVALVLGAILMSGSLRQILNRRVLIKTGMVQSARYTLSAVIVYTTIGIVCIIALNVSGLPLAGLGIFAGASGLAIGFGMQTILSNFVSGLIIMIERHVKVGDCVKVGEDLIGYVERINARSTTIATFDNYRVIIPNSEFIEKQVVNWSTQDPKLRLGVDVGIAYGADTGLARDCLMKVANENELALKQPEPEVRFLGFGDSSLAFQVLVWVADVRDYYRAISSLHFEIDQAFRENGIEIAFPQQDLHLRSVDDGAARLLQRPTAGPPDSDEASQA